MINKTWPIHHLRCVVSTTSFAWGDRSSHWTCGTGRIFPQRVKPREGSVCPFMDFICSSSFRQFYLACKVRREKNYSSSEIILYSARFADNGACWWIISRRMRQATVTRITGRLSVNAPIYSFETLASRIERREKTGKLGENNVTQTKQLTSSDFSACNDLIFMFLFSWFSLPSWPPLWTTPSTMAL